MSVVTVQQGTVAVITVFGKFRRSCVPGLVFASRSSSASSGAFILDVDGRYKTFLPGVAKEIPFPRRVHENMQRTIKELMAQRQERKIKLYFKIFFGDAIRTSLNLYRFRNHYFEGFSG